MTNRFKLPRAISVVYKLITGKPFTATASEVSLSFLNLTSKLIIAKALVMVSSILVGKYLGPSQFGSLTLILAIGNFWCLPFFTSWGLAYVNCSSRSNSEHLAEEYLSSSLAMSIISVSFWMLLLLGFKDKFSDIVNVTQDIWVFGCFFGILMGCYYFFKTTFQARQNWSSFATCEIFFAASLTLGLLLLFLGQPARKFGAVLTAFVLAHLVGSLPAIRVVFRDLRIPKPESFIKIAHHGFALMVSFGLSLIAMQLDKLFLNLYADSEAVGRYQAYYVSTFGLLSAFTTILNNYLLPLYGKYDIQTLKKILLRFLLVTSFPFCLCCLLCGRLAFILFGKSFNFNWFELAWASAFNVVIFCLQVVVFFSMTLGKNALLCNSAVYIVFISVQVISMPFLIQQSGVTGAFQGMTAASAVALGILLGMLPILSNQKGQSE